MPVNEDFVKALQASDLYDSLVGLADEERNLYVTMDKDWEVFLYSKPERGIDHWTVMGELVGAYDGMSVGYLNSPVPLDWRACCVLLRRVAGHQHQSDINEVLPEIDSTEPDAWI